MWLEHNQDQKDNKTSANMETHVGSNYLNSAANSPSPSSHLNVSM